MTMPIHDQEMTCFWFCFSTTGMPLNMFGLGIGTTSELIITYISLLVDY